MKNRLFSLVAVVTVSLAVSSGAKADEKLDAVEKDLIKVWDKINAMSADITMSFSMPGMTNNGTGQVEFVQKKGKQRFRMDMKSEVVSQGQNMKVDSFTVYDGEFVYSLNDMNGQKMAMKNNPDKAQMQAPIGKSMFESLKEQNNLRVLPDETVDGEVAYVIEAKPKQAPAGQEMTMKMYFVKKHGILVKILGLDGAGVETMSMIYKNVKINPDIDESRFVFKAPDGVQVMDMTASQ